MIFDEKPFFLFGMGHREKYIYSDGKLYRYPDTDPVWTAQVLSEEILPAEYRVELVTADGKISLYEDEEGFYLQREGGEPECLTAGHVNLPSFDGYRWRDQLRILHSEILVNIYNGFPVPSFLVYRTPWYRDGAMMAMVLKETGNIGLIRDWAAGLDSLYDRNNAGMEEPDNLGQLLYLLALTGNGDHKLIGPAIEEAKRRSVDGTLTGKTDFSEHPVYSTKWMKLGLDALGLDSSWLKIPASGESYGRLFWMDGHKETYTEVGYNEKYPYLSWAAIHSADLPVPEDRIAPVYPMSLEIRASQADYPSEAPFFPALSANKCSAPHTWHAAEMFLYLIKFTNKENDNAGIC